MAIWCAIVALLQICFVYYRDISQLGLLNTPTIVSFSFTVACHCLTLLSSIYITYRYYRLLRHHNDQQNRDSIITQPVANKISSICCIVGGCCSLIIGISGIFAFYGLYGSPNCYLGISVSNI